jgi:hypothetical protein
MPDLKRPWRPRCVRGELRAVPVIALLNAIVLGGMAWNWITSA